MPAQILINDTALAENSGIIEVTGSMLPATLQANGFTLSGHTAKVFSTTGILTFAEGTFIASIEPEDGFISIGGINYTPVVTVDNTFAGEFLIEGDTTLTLDNFVAAINLGPGSGTKYDNNTLLNPFVTAVRNTANTVLVTAREPGTAGNSITTTETVTGANWITGTLLGGSDDDPKEVFIDSNSFQLQGTVTNRLVIRFPLRFEVRKTSSVNPSGISIAYGNEV